MTPFGEYERRALEQALRTLKCRTLVFLEDFATCVEGPHAHALLQVMAVQRYAGIAYVRLCPKREVRPMPIARLYHLFDYLDALALIDAELRRRPN